MLNKKNGDDVMATVETVRIKPILPTPTLSSSDSEMVLSELTKPISETRKEELKQLRMFFRQRKSIL
jgi:hypothetical protein